MTIPLWALAFFSLFVGFVGIPGANNRFEHFLETWNPHGATPFHLGLALVSTVLAVGGLLGARAVYRRAAPGTDPLPARLGPLWTLWNRLYYVDDLYLFLVRRVQQGIARLCWLFERWVVIQAFANDYYKLPTPEELHQLFEHWRATRMEGYLVFAWRYPDDRPESWLANHPELQAQLAIENGAT